MILIFVFLKFFKKIPTVLLSSVLAKSLYFFHRIAGPSFNLEQNRTQLSVSRKTFLTIV